MPPSERIILVVKSDTSGPNKGPPIIHTTPECTITTRDTSSIDNNDSDEELGDLIYQQSRTAKARQAETKKVAASTDTYECSTNQNQSSNIIGRVSIPSECDDILSGADWDQPYSVREKIPVPTKRKITTEGGNCPAPPKTPDKTCHKWYTNKAQEGEACISHDTKIACKGCSHGGCNNQAVNGGICVIHGGNERWLPRRLHMNAQQTRTRVQTLSAACQFLVKVMSY